MKKIFLISFLIVFMGTAMAGNPETQASGKLGFGLEAGLMGAGINLTFSASKHVCFTLGYNFPELNYKLTEDARVGKVNKEIAALNSRIRELNMLASKYEVPNRLDEVGGINGQIDANVGLNLKQFKMLMEYYPCQSRSFHLVFGLFIGSKNLINLSAHTSRNDWQVYKDLQRNYESSNAFLESINKKAGKKLLKPLNLPTSNIEFSYDGSTYIVEDLNGDGTGDISGSLKVNKVKPYFGIGFGRSIPRNRVAFQFEIGVWYHGKPELTIDNSEKMASEVSVDADDTVEGIMKTVNKVQFWPQLTLRLTGKIF